MKKKQTLIDRDYSEWGIIPNLPVGTGGESFTVTLNENWFNLGEVVTTGAITWTVGQATINNGYRPTLTMIDEMGVHQRSYNDSMMASQLALREQLLHDSAMDLAITGSSAIHVDSNGTMRNI